MWARAAHLHARVGGARVADGIEVKLEGGTGGVFENGEQTDWLDVLPLTVPALPAGVNALLAAGVLARDQGYLAAYPVEEGETIAWYALRTRLGPAPDLQRDVWCTLTGQPKSRAYYLAKGKEGYLGDAAVEQLIDMLDGEDVTRFSADAHLPPCFMTGVQEPRIYASLTAVSLRAFACAFKQINEHRVKNGFEALRKPTMVRGAAPG